MSPEQLQPITSVLEHPRTILIGSFARAALLRNSLELLLEERGPRFKDIDCIDRSGQLRHMYRLAENGFVLDFQTTRELHPTEGGVWGLFVPTDSEPVCEFSEDLLELGTVRFPDGPSVVTPSPAVHVELTRLALPPFPKHKDQIRRVKELVVSGERPPIAEMIDEYRAVLKLKPSTPYQRLRRTFIRRLPRVAVALSSSIAGQGVRKLRHTEPEILEASGSDFYLSATESLPKKGS